MGLFEIMYAMSSGLGIKSFQGLAFSGSEFRILGFGVFRVPWPCIGI